jgi:hypothetical protein
MTGQGNAETAVEAIDEWIQQPPDAYSAQARPRVMTPRRRPSPPPGS